MGFNADLIVVTILVSLVSFVFTGLILNAATNYGITVDPELQSTFDKYNETQKQFEETQQIIQGGEINPEGQDQAIYKNVVVAGKQMQQQGNLMVLFLGQVSKFLNIEAVVLAMIGTLIMILVAIGFLVMITKQAP